MKLMNYHRRRQEHQGARKAVTIIYNYEREQGGNNYDRPPRDINYTRKMKRVL